ncbi:hypothetical protein AVEN_219010-1 [Araneus ventricosus]|uniref:Uncharacterized protein n=1 Tax=Araneus ventricosus TaxID=182803 RepID=A0A4Y2CC14_ARAVE|nr:hypothetical protein AVEN_219010-1 [Araneus ventricosus]
MRQELTIKGSVTISVDHLGTPRFFLHHADGRMCVCDLLAVLSVHSSKIPPSNLKELRVVILLSWANIPPQRFQQPVESMPRRISAIIKAREGSIRLILSNRVF